MAKHIGSSFDDFLKEEGILKECKEEAAKRVHKRLTTPEQSGKDSKSHEFLNGSPEGH